MTVSLGVRRLQLRRVLRWGGVAILIALVALVALPVGRYLLRAAWEEGRILARRRPIAEVIGDSTTDATTRRRLRVVVDARAFAVQRIGLNAKEGFTTYSALEHDTLVLVVSAAHRDRLEAYTWWFPVVGRVPYKGFFDYAEAERAARDLRDRDFDTYVRPASAFSTLGWFNDPLLSTTLGLDTLALANTVIHELTHNSVFVPSQMTFNESFASFVGARGAMAFFRSRGAVAAAERSARRWQDDKVLAGFWSTAKAAIDSALGAHSDDRRARLEARDAAYRRLRAALLDDVAPRLSTIPRQYLESLPLDNASLLAHRVYASEPWLFDEVLRRQNGDLQSSVRLIAQLVRGSDDPFASIRVWLQRPAVGPEAARSISDSSTPSRTP